MRPTTAATSDNGGENGTSTGSIVRDELARNILDETWDLLESPIFRDAASDCLDATFCVMRDEYWGRAFEATDVVVGCESSPSRYATLPLATVLTKFKKTANSFFDDTCSGRQQQQVESSPTSVCTSANADIESGHLEEGTNRSNDSKIARPKSVSCYCTALEQLHTVMDLADVSFN